MVSDRLHHHRTFWGICFPLSPPPSDQTAIYMIKKNLERNGQPLLQPSVQRLDLTVVLSSVIAEGYRELVEHSGTVLSLSTINFCAKPSTGSAENPSPLSSDTDRRHTGPSFPR